MTPESGAQAQAQRCCWNLRSIDDETRGFKKRPPDSEDERQERPGAGCKSECGCPTLESLKKTPVAAIDAGRSHGRRRRAASAEYRAGPSARQEQGGTSRQSLAFIHSAVSHE